MRKKAWGILWGVLLVACSLMTGTEISSGSQEPIRLRVLAHSNRMEDQWIKRVVRDTVLAHVQPLATLQHTQQARRQLASQLGSLQGAVQEVLARYGFSYAVQMTLAEVPFPAKHYGRTSYPAGNYEALRIVLGSGEGDNWWCVLYPKLCAVDLEMAKQSELIAAPSERPTTATIEPTKVQARSWFWEQWQQLRGAS